MQEIRNVTCVIKAWDPSLAHNLKKIHGPQAAKDEGWPEDHPGAKANLPLGSDPLDSLGKLYELIAGWSPEERKALGRIQIDFNRG